MQTVHPHLDIRAPEHVAEFHTFLQEVFLSRGYVDLGLGGPRLGLAGLGLGLHDGEEPLDADGDAHAGDVAFLGVKHPHQLVVTTPTSNATNMDGLA